MLAPALEVLAGEAPRDHCRGWAIFCGDGRTLSLALPAAPRVKVTVGERFHVRPLLPLLHAEPPFHVLAMSQSHVRVLACDAAGARPVEVPGLPESLQAALGGELQSEYRGAHSGVHAYGGKAAAVFHGGGSATAETKHELPRFLQRVDAALLQAPRVRDELLVLAGVGYLVAMFRQVSHHRHLAAEAVVGNPDDASPAQLHHQARLAAWPELGAEERQGLEHYRQLAGTPRTCSTLTAALAAANAGRVETLFLAPETEVWGRVAADGAVELHDARQGGDEDLLDRLVALTLRSDGRIFTTSDIPSGAEVAAVLRY